MMLYVFHVDTGDLMKLDMSLATETVQALKEHVEEKYRIPADTQVLLISGGECLDPSKRVCSYSAGTDTNPIYMFSRYVEVRTPSKNFIEDIELLDMQLKSDKMSPSLQSVNFRTELASSFAVRAFKLLEKCKELVNDQHNQHQGWSAVMANFEDVIAEFKDKFAQAERDFTKYWQDRDYYVQFLRRYRKDIQTLRKISILPKLLRSQDGARYVTDGMGADLLGAQNDDLLDAQNDDLLAAQKDDLLGARDDDAADRTKKRGDGGNDANLYDWIFSNENRLMQMYEKCVFTLDTYPYEKFVQLARGVAEALGAAEQATWKEIKGLDKRLYQLGVRTTEMNKKVEEQREYANAFMKKDKRVEELCKDSIALSKLSDDQRLKLEKMAKHHADLMEYHLRCQMAKNEFCSNLDSRLEWVSKTQTEMQKLGDQMDMLCERLATLRYMIGVLEQIEVAPVAYLSYVAEVVRRRSFSQNFVAWASELACRLLTLHNEEVARRKDFSGKFEEHFVQALFPGMKDMPSGYGTQAPEYFDTDLPKLTQEDVEFLRKELPDLAEHLNAAPESTDTTPYLMFRSILRAGESLEKLDEATSTENLSQQPKRRRRNDVNEEEEEEEDDDDEMEQEQEIAQAQMMDEVKSTKGEEELEEESRVTAASSSGMVLSHGLPHLKDLERGCESETDTEEFEKVGQSPLELHFDNKELPSPSPSRPQATRDASTSTTSSEGNLEVSRNDYDKLKSAILNIGALATHTIAQLKNELTNIKLQYSSDKHVLVQSLQKVIASYETLCSEQENREKTLTQRLTAEHANEISDFRKLAQVKNEEIKSLRTNNAFLDNKLKKTTEETRRLKEDYDKNEETRAELEKRVNFLETDKEKCVKEVTERLNREHRDEIKTLQARFKLMTMERSPSESSLEKTYDSLTNRESIISQMTENFEVEKEKLVRETIETEARKWERLLQRVRENNEIEKELLSNEWKERLEKGEMEWRANMDEVTERLKGLEKIRADEETVVQMAVDVEEVTTTKGSEEETENGGGDVATLKDKIRALECDKEALNAELRKVKEELQQQQQSDITISVVGAEADKTDSATSPIRRQNSLTRSLSCASTSTGAAACVGADRRMHKFNVDATLKRGDCVVVVWDEQHESFIIVQDSPVKYFLHPENAKSLGLEVEEGPPKKPNKLFCLAEYWSKEYCKARKNKNRFKVTKDSKFFRVELRPLSRKRTPEPSTSTALTEDSAEASTPRPIAAPSAVVHVNVEQKFHSLPPSPKTAPADTAVRSLTASCEVETETGAHEQLGGAYEDTPFISARADLASLTDADDSVR